MTGELIPFTYREYPTRRNSTASKGPPTKMTEGASWSAVTAPSVPSTTTSLVPTPVLSRVPTPVPSVIYSPYDTPRGSIAPDSTRHNSPAPESPVISHIDSTRPSLDNPTSISSSQIASDHHTVYRGTAERGPYQRYRPAIVYNPINRQRRVSISLAAEKGKPVGYGVTRNAKIVSIQANGKVKVGKEPKVDCCNIL